VENKNAKVLEKRFTASCSVCFLLDTDQKDMKFHLWEVEEGFGLNPKTEEKHICDECLNWLREIRKMCHKQIDNPKKDIFKDVKMWHDCNNPEKSGNQEKAIVPVEK